MAPPGLFHHMQPAVGRAGEAKVGAFSGRAWGEVDPSILFLWGPQCACLRAQVTGSCLILGKGIIESEPGGGKSSGMNQAGNPEGSRVCEACRKQ